MRERLKKSLSWISDLVKVDMTSLTKAGFWTNLAQGVNMLTAFGINIVFARLLSATIIGEYKYFLSINALLQSVTLSGLGTVVTQAISRKEFGVYPLAIQRALRWGGVVIAIGAVAAIVLGIVQHDAQLGLIIFFLACVTPLNDAAALYANVLIGQQRFTSLALRQMSASVAQFFALALVSIFFPGSISLLFALIMANLILNVLWSYQLWNKNSEARPHHSDDIRFAYHLSFINAFSSVSSQADRLIVFHALGPISLAIYSFAVAVPKQIRTMFGFVGSFALPRYASKDPRQLLASVQKHFLLAQLVLLPLMVLYIIAAPTIYQYLFPNYQEAARLSMIYALITPVYGNYSGVGLQVLKNASALYKMNVFTFCVMVSSLLAGWQLGGITGIVIGFVIAKYIGSLTTYLVLHYQVKQLVRTTT